MAIIRNRFRIAIVVAVAALALPSVSSAQRAEFSTVSTKRFTMLIGKSDTWSNRENQRYQDLAEDSLKFLETTDDELSRILDYNLKHKVVLRFLPASEFREQTGAPAWTNAMFYDGQISIPVGARQGMGSTELKRALRHEYTHAIIAELTDQRSPAWIDEGLAQLIEGPPNPILGPSLRKWNKDNPILPLSWLQDGFMTLDDDLVPVAYAESLFATRTLVNSDGMKPIHDYLSRLGKHEDEQSAFMHAFGRSEVSFEKQLQDQISRWAESAEPNP